jgi:DNA-binding GntR family transcriptional regulator
MRVMTARVPSPHNAVQEPYREKPSPLEEAASTATGTRMDKVFEAIELALITGAIPPGSRLGEDMLCRRFDVSRAPLREALRQLEGRGLVVRLPHAGVCAVSLKHSDLIDLYELRESLEGAVCRLAAERMLPEEIAELRLLLTNHRGSQAFRDGTHHGDLDFHYMLAKGARSSRLERLLCKDLYSLIRLCRFTFAHTPGRCLRAHRDHERILDAIEDRDPDLAELLMRRHIADARRQFSDQIDHQSRIG